MKPLPTDSLDLTIVVFKNTHNRQVADGQLSGVVNSDMDLGLLRDALNQANLLINLNLVTRALECHINPGFFISLEALIGAPKRRITAPERFYLADVDYLYSGNPSSPPDQVRHYLAATKLFSLLAKEADHQGGVGDAKTLIFLHQEKIEITSQYNVENLQGLKSLDSFESQFITSTTHQEQKRTIVKTVLLQMFSGQKKLAFGKFLESFEDFFEKVQASYELYVSEFSFKKIKAEVEKEKLDAMVKLNKVFSDIQSQLLAVPAALVLVGGQMEKKDTWDSKNILIWLGALVFAVLMDLLIRNQRHTLKAVKHEIDQQREQLESKYQSVAARFSGIYIEINSRHKHQNRLIWIVDLLVAVSLGITTVLLLCFSGVIC